MPFYSKEFYANRHQNTLYSATTILNELIGRIPLVDSAVDIGCGLGTWLSVLREKGVKDILGVDGDWVDPGDLAISVENFKSLNLAEEDFGATRKFDLAMSMEVAEHLPPERASTFVDMLCALSDLVLFSAAVPYQGGVNHINEQWQEYWVELFKSRDFICYDFLRSKIWADQKIPYWYRQNLFLFVHSSKTRQINISAGDFESSKMPLNVVHPALHLKNQAQ